MTDLIAYIRQLIADKFTGRLVIDFSQGSPAKVEKVERVK